MSSTAGDSPKREVKGRGTKPRLRTDGRWEVRRTIDGKSYSGYGPTPAKAVESLNRTIAETPRTKFGRRGTEPRLADVFERFYTDVGSLRQPRTQQTYRLAKTRMMPLLGRFRVSQLTKQMLREVYRGLSHLDVRSVEQSHDVLCACVNWAIDEGVLQPDSSNPFARLRLTTSSSPGRLNLLDLSQLAKLFETMEGSYWQILFMLLAVTGCRLGEALGLSWDQCFLDQRDPYIRFCQAAVWHERLKRHYIARRLKNEHSPREVTVHPWLAAALRDLRERQNEARISGTIFRDAILEEPDPRNDSVLKPLRGDPVRLVFVAPVTRGIVDGRYVHQPLERALTKAGLPRMRVHDLRHSCATNLFAAGYPPELVSERLGHGSIHITLKTYKAYIPPLHKRMGNAQDPWGAGWGGSESTVPQRPEPSAGQPRGSATRPLSAQRPPGDSPSTDSGRSHQPSQRHLRRGGRPTRGRTLSG